MSPTACLRTSLAITRAALSRVQERQASFFAAGVAYYVFLSLFPAMMTSTFAYGLFTDGATLARHADRITELLPSAEAAAIVTEQMRALEHRSFGALGSGATVALLLTLWSASRGVNSLLHAIRWVIGVPDQRSATRRAMLSIGLTLGSILFLVVALGLVAALPAVVELLRLEGAWLLLRAARWALLALILAFVIGELFVAATESRLRLRAVFAKGVFVAVILFLAASLGFSAYVDIFANYDKTYGAVAGVVVLLLWIWLGAFAVLVGAAFEHVFRERELTGGE